MSSPAAAGSAVSETRSAGKHSAGHSVSDDQLAGTVSADSPRPTGLFSARTRKLILVIAVLGGVALLLDEFVKYRVVAKRFGTVYDGELYRSGQISRWMFEKTVKSHGIQVVIDLNGREPESEHQTAEIASAEKLNLELYRFPLGGDGRGDITRYADAIETIHTSRTAGKPVLVHCAAGTQRTGGVVATYRMLVRGESPATAWDEMVDYGWKPEKEQELLDYINGNMRTLATMLVERGVIAQIPEPLPVLSR